MEKIKGFVDHIIFRNKENGYSVFVLENEDGELTCVGSFAVLEEGELLELTGELVQHPTYGTQLQVRSFQTCAPEDLLAIERYLGSGSIKGLGRALAGRIVARFREETFRIIEEEPERLAEIKGISERKAREIALQVEEKKGLRQALIYLQRFGISTTLAAKIYQVYEQNIYQIIEENPYRLAEDISGIGFKTADEIAARVGLHVDSAFRIKSGIYYVMMESVGEGHVYLDKTAVLNRTRELLQVELSDIETYLMDLAMEKKLVLKTHDDKLRVYTAAYYYMEVNVAKMLVDLNDRFAVNETAARKRIAVIEDQAAIRLDEVQQEAILAAARGGITVLTGGPGTGKTTTINALIRFFREEDSEILLGAPTGRAAKRMQEATGYEASTIHRLLEVSGNPEEGHSGFNRNEEYPLEADVIIIDEMSMVDLALMQALLKAVIRGTRLILVGDMNQLPSVGAGKVLEDIITSDCFPVVRLTKIFRQAQESDIVVNAHKINAGQPIVLDNHSRDFFFLKRSEAAAVIGVTMTLVRDKLPRYVKATPFDIQVLTPTRKGLLGVENLNLQLQHYLNPAGPQKAEKENGDHLLREGDKVMQIKNNYQLEWEITTPYGLTVDQGLGVYNGDMGVIKKISHFDETLVVEFDDRRRVTYQFNQLDELELAYAVTVHKSQGSEYPAVVIPLLNGPRQLYHRNLIYTAVTRARSCVIIVGSAQVFAHMVQNTSEQKRNTSLAERIRELN